MVDEHSPWESFQDPRVLQGVERRDSLRRIPLETLADEVEESFALVANDFFQGPRAWSAQCAVWLLENVDRLVCSRLEELVSALCARQDPLRRPAKGLHNQ